MNHPPLSGRLCQVEAADRLRSLAAYHHGRFIRRHGLLRISAPAAQPAVSRGPYPLARPLEPCTLVAIIQWCGRPTTYEYSTYEIILEGKSLGMLSSDGLAANHSSRSKSCIMCATLCLIHS